MPDNREGEWIRILDDSEERSSLSHDKTQTRWGINYLEADDTFDFQLHYVKFHRVYKILTPHVHENRAEIVYMLHGMQYYNVDGRDYRVLGGQLLISPPGLVHSSREDPEQKGDFYYLTINPDCLPFLLPNDPETAASLRELLVREVVVRAIVDVEELRGLAEEVRQAYIGTAHCRKCRILCAILRLLLHTEDTVQPEDSLGQYSDFMGRLYLYIEDHITEKLGVDDIAHVAQYSKTALQQKFKTYSHLTVHEYILTRKIEAAKRLMKEPDVNPHKVWKMLSFSSQSYFAQVFRQYTGMTITQYLNRREESEPDGTEGVSAPS